MLALTFAWDRLHPVVVHFPIALLLTAPLFVAAAIVMPKARNWLSYAATWLLALGTAAAFVALSTGDAASDVARVTGPIKATLEQHEELAESTAVTFAILTGILALIAFLPRWYKKLDRPRWRTAALAVMLALLIGADVLLGIAAHQGGRLVHDFGVRAGGPPTIVSSR